MSDTNKGDQAPRGQSDTSDESGFDPRPLEGSEEPVEWVAAAAGAAALVAFQVVVKAFAEKGDGQDVAWSATEENEDIQPIEEEEEEEDEDEFLELEELLELEEVLEELRADNDVEDEEDDNDDAEGEGADHEDTDQREDSSEEEEEDDSDDEGEEAAGAYFPEYGTLDAKIRCKLGYYFRDLVAPRYLSLAKKATAYNDENSDEDTEESEDEEDDENEELEEGPQKDLDSAEGSFP